MTSYDAEDRANLQTVIDFEKNYLTYQPPGAVTLASSFSQDLQTQTRIIDAYHLLVQELLAQAHQTKASKLSALTKILEE